VWDKYKGRWRFLVPQKTFGGGDGETGGDGDLGWGRRLADAGPGADLRRRTEGAEAAAGAQGSWMDGKEWGTVG